MPDTGPDELLVGVHACGVDPVDWKIREGYIAQMVRHRMPIGRYRRDDFLTRIADGIPVTGTYISGVRKQHI